VTLPVLPEPSSVLMSTRVLGPSPVMVSVTSRGPSSPVRGVEGPDLVAGCDVLDGGGGAVGEQYGSAGQEAVGGTGDAVLFLLLRLLVLALPFWSEPPPLSGGLSGASVTSAHSPWTAPAASPTTAVSSASKK